MSTFVSIGRQRSRLLILGLLVALLPPAATAAEPADLEPIKREIRELSRQSIRLRHELSNSAADRELLAAVESALAQLRNDLGQLETLASAVGSAAFRVRFLREEMESKNRTLEQVKQVTQELSAQYARRSESLEGERRAIEARRRIFQLPDEQPELDAFDRDVEDFNTKLTALQTEFARVNAERREAFANGLAACTAALKEFAAAEEKERKAVEDQNDVLRAIGSLRQQYTDAIVAADRRPAPSFGPLTPFPTGGVTPAEARSYLRERPAPPTTPGTVKDPLRQLRVVVRNSQVATEGPGSIEAKHSSGNKIDTEEGVNDEVVPLVIESPVPTPVGSPVPPSAPPLGERPPAQALASSPLRPPVGSPSSPMVPAKVRAAEAAQQEQIVRLDALYQQRNEIVKHPQDFGPQALTHVINDISETHGKIIFDDYTKKAAGGSKNMIALDVDTDREGPAPPAPPPSPPPAPVPAR